MFVHVYRETSELCGMHIIVIIIAIMSSVSSRFLKFSFKPVADLKDKNIFPFRVFSGQSLGLFFWTSVSLYGEQE